MNAPAPSPHASTNSPSTLGSPLDDIGPSVYHAATSAIVDDYEMAADSPLKRLMVQTSHYGLTSLFNMVAGLVTFPILTRLFSVADYGTMTLIAATLTVSVAVAKVGVQHSIVRYHSEIDAGKSKYSLAQL